MLELNLPKYSFKMRKEGGKLFIFDEYRRRYVVLTPEEWVRQNFLSFLVQERGFPRGLIANEVSLVLNGMNRRCDSLIYNRAGLPIVIIEYKAPHVAIDELVTDQIGRYNLVFGVDHLIVTNGFTHLYFQRVDGVFTMSLAIPQYDDVL